MINKTLLCATLAKVQEEAGKPEGECLWQQQVWSGHASCGTTYCFAGWTVVLAEQSMPTRVAGTDAETYYAVNGKMMHISKAATILLGLSEQQADTLFSADNSIDEIERIIEEIFDSEEAEA